MNIHLPQLLILAWISLHSQAHGQPAHRPDVTPVRRISLKRFIPQTDIDWMRNAALEQLQGCRVQASNGIWLHTPDGVGNYRALWTRDFQYMVEQAGDLLSTNDIIQSIRYLLKGQRADGCMPDRVNTTGQGVYSPGAESSPLADRALDNGPFMAKLLVEATRLTGDLDFFREMEPSVRRGLDHTFRAPNGLVFNSPNDPQCPYGFTDTVKKTGHLLFCSLLYYDACIGMEKLCKQTECGEPQVYQRRAQLIRLNLDTLWDARTGMFIAADEDCRQIDIWGSALAAHLNVATPSQCDRISSYLVEHYPELTQHGQIRHLPANEHWNTLFTKVAPGTYQNGAYWATPIAWTAPVIARKDPKLAVQMIHQAIADFQNRGITECINGDYHNVPNYVVSATSIYSLLK